ncbi:MAG: hypothetical protein JNJ88_12340 [Planctomycetes bacterium]|nr:hypothetical protein [Planctomycetota bacterium]
MASGPNLELWTFWWEFNRKRLFPIKRLCSPWELWLRPRVSARSRKKEEAIGAHVPTSIASNLKDAPQCERQRSAAMLIAEVSEKPRSSDDY